VNRSFGDGLAGPEKAGSWGRGGGGAAAILARRGPLAKKWRGDLEGYLNKDVQGGERGCSVAAAGGGAEAV
jgi:hypothetical protein